MSQHYLLSANARTLSIVKIAMMNEEEIFEIFKRIRWSATNGEPVCPCCGSMRQPYNIKARQQFRCKDCFHTFSVTSGTLFSGHKLPLKTYLLAIAIFTNSAKSLSALQLSRDLDVQYKTAWILSHIKSGSHYSMIMKMKCLQEYAKLMVYMLVEKPDK